jgi:aspartyl-tRNA(Asn)/glutamyl-tRNA(Gln) amidotransferase subunit B
MARSASSEETASLSPEVRAKYEPVIGLEVHVQLLTNTKIFCTCSARFGDPPNTNTCPVCLGLPGTLPVLNRRAVEMAIRASLALNCTVHEHSRFARKNYFYPDLPKGYQISQYELPLATGGRIQIDSAERPIGITRLHLEEDAAKNLHEGFAQSAEKAYIDFNRCGTPLIEIVSEPDMRTPEEAYAYLATLRQILLYTGVSDCNMEEGSLRCDGNVSVRRHGAKEFGTKVEVKNLNSFRFLQKALEYEIERQITVLESGGRIPQETRLWHQNENRTVAMRSKEKAHDYRYFPEPDLLPVHVSAAWRDEVLRSLPELPAAKRARFVAHYAITPYDAEVLTTSQVLADYFEAAAKAGAPGKSAANWIQTELLRRLNDSGKEISASPISPSALAELVKLVESGKITGAVAKRVFATMFDSGRSAAEIVAEEGLGAQVEDSVIRQAARDVIAKNPENVAKFRSGNEGVFKFFVGQVMKATRGQATPQLVNQVVEILTKELGQAGQIPRESYEDILSHLRGAKDWAATHGLQDALGRFSIYETNIETLIGARKSGGLGRLVKDKGNAALMWSLVESMELSDFQQTLRNVEPSILKERLKKALKGPILPTHEDRNTNEARNIAFELGLASFLSSAGFEVQLTKQHDSDLEAKLGDVRLVIECKRLLSERRFEEHLSDATSSLASSLNQRKDAWGLIAVDITKLKNIGDHVYDVATPMGLRLGLGDLLETTLQENWDSLKRISDRRIIGLLLYIHTPAFVQSESLLTAAKYFAIWPLHSPGTAEYRALDTVARRIQQRVEEASA